MSFTGPFGGPPVAVGLVPAAVRELLARQPVEGVAGFRQAAAHLQAHGGLDVIPGIGLVARAPGNFAAGFLGGRDQARNGSDGEGRAVFLG